MSHLPKVLSALSRLLSYPDEQIMQAAELLYVVLRDELPEAAREAAQFGRFLEQHDVVRTGGSLYAHLRCQSGMCAWRSAGICLAKNTRGACFWFACGKNCASTACRNPPNCPITLPTYWPSSPPCRTDEAERFVRACVQPAVAAHAAGAGSNRKPVPARGVLSGVGDARRAGGPPRPTGHAARVRIAGPQVPTLCTHFPWPIWKCAESLW